MRDQSISAAGDPAPHLDFTPADVRHRRDGWTPDRQREFLEALADCGVIRHAAAEVGMTEQSVGRLRRRADGGPFDLACEAALRLGARRLRSVAFERAVEGTVRGHYYHGELISEERVYDHRLLTYLLGKTSHLFTADPRAVKAERAWEATLDALDPAPPPETASWTEDEVWFDEDEGCWCTNFPPPPDFAGVEDGEPGDEFYSRAVTDAEQAVIEAQQAAALAVEADRRDRAFAPRAAPRSDRPAGDAAEANFSTPREAEPSEPSAGSDP